MISFLHQLFIRIFLNKIHTCLFVRTFQQVHVKGYRAINSTQDSSRSGRLFFSLAMSWNPEMTKYSEKRVCISEPKNVHTFLEQEVICENGPNVWSIKKLSPSFSANMKLMILPAQKCNGEGGLRAGLCQYQGFQLDKRSYFHLLSSLCMAQQSLYWNKYDFRVSVLDVPWNQNISDTLKLQLCKISQASFPTYANSGF